VIATGGVIAGTTMAGAQAAPVLPARSAATLLADVQGSSGPGPMTATVQSVANLGLPALPGGDGPSSGLSLLSGTHTFNIWYGGPGHVRIAEPTQLGESDLRVNGRQVWLWDSKTQTATHVVLPPCPQRQAVFRAAPGARPRWLTITRLPGARVRISLPGGKSRIVPLSRLRDHLPLAGLPKFRDSAHVGFAGVSSGPTSSAYMSSVSISAVRVSHGCAQLPGHASPRPAVPDLTPQQLARQILAAVGPTTTVSVQQNVSVAGQAAYQLAIAPKDHRSLVGRITIAIDAARHFPLRVQVFARGSAGPAFQLGFTSLSFGRPAASNFTFTPPPGAKVKTIKVPAGPFGPGALGLPVANPAAARRLFARPLDKFQSGGSVRVKGWNDQSEGIYSSSVSWGSNGTDNGGGFVNVPTGPRVMGSGWLSVLVVPPGAGSGPATTFSTYGSIDHPTDYSKSVTIVSSPPGGPGAATDPVHRALLQAATPVHGTWGSGRLLRTALVSALITSKGTVLIGAVTPSVLYADAATLK
jgi:outer membrane lipoprotein-sorting protein